MSNIFNDFLAWAGESEEAVDVVGTEYNKTVVDTETTTEEIELLEETREIKTISPFELDDVEILKIDKDPYDQIQKEINNNRSVPLTTSTKYVSGVDNGEVCKDKLLKDDVYKTYVALMINSNCNPDKKARYNYIYDNKFKDVQDMLYFEKQIYITDENGKKVKASITKLDVNGDPVKNQKGEDVKIYIKEAVKVSNKTFNNHIKKLQEVGLMEPVEGNKGAYKLYFEDNSKYYNTIPYPILEELLLNTNSKIVKLYAVLSYMLDTKRFKQMDRAFLCRCTGMSTGDRQKHEMSLALRTLAKLGLIQIGRVEVPGVKTPLEYRLCTLNEWQNYNKNIIKKIS